MNVHSVGMGALLFVSITMLGKPCSVRVPVQSAKMSAGLSRSHVTADRPQTSCGSERLQFHSRRRSQGTKDTHHVDKQRALGGEQLAIGCNAVGQHDDNGHVPSKALGLNEDGFSQCLQPQRGVGLSALDFEGGDVTQQVGLVKVAVEVELDLGGRRVWAAGREARQRC